MRPGIDRATNSNLTCGSALRGCFQAPILSKSVMPESTHLGSLVGGQPTAHLSALGLGMVPPRLVENENGLGWPACLVVEISQALLEYGFDYPNSVCNLAAKVRMIVSDICEQYPHPGKYRMLQDRPFLRLGPDSFFKVELRPLRLVKFVGLGYNRAINFKPACVSIEPS